MTCLRVPNDCKIECWGRVVVICKGAEIAYASDSKLLRVNEVTGDLLCGFAVCTYLSMGLEKLQDSALVYGLP